MSKKKVKDTPEQIKNCLSCPLPYCTNCLFNGGENGKRNRKHEFFGEMLTIKEIADMVGVEQYNIYNWKKSGGMKHVERMAKKKGYDPEKKGRG